MEHQRYLSMALLIERLHRRFLDIVKRELESLGIEDINNVQTLILYNIGNEVLTVGELTNRGYYLGSNVSYNIKKLVENEYLVQERSPHDKRSVKVKLSERGLDLISQIDSMFKRHIDYLNSEDDFSEDKVEGGVKVLRSLERYWSEQLRDTYEF